MDCRETIRGIDVTVEPKDISGQFEYDGRVHLMLNNGGVEKLRNTLGEPNEGDFRYILVCMKAG